MTDRQLSELLHDAVADVEPARTYDDLDALTGRRPRRVWVPLSVAAAAVATALVLVGIPWLADRPGEPAAPPPPIAAAPERIDVVAYALVETPAGLRLAADRRSVPNDTNQLMAAVSATVMDRPADPDYRRLLPARDAYSVASGTVEGQDQVDLYERGGVTRPLPADVSALVPQALTWTAALAAGDRGHEVRLGFGFDSRGTRMDEPVFEVSVPRLSDAVFAPVMVESVGEGEVVEGPVTVSGLATTFEGTVAWRLLDGEEVVREGFTTTEECCTPSPYSFEVDAPPGDYVLEVSETDPSGGEGFPAYVDTKSITIR